MNSIAMQIDYMTDELAMLNRVLEARENYRRLSDAAAKSRGKFGTVADQMAMDALYKLTRLEREYRDNFAPFEVIADTPDVEPLPDCGETFPKRKRVVRLHPDDPRKGQAESTNRQNRSI